MVYWLSLPVSQRSLSTCSPLTLVLAQWFWPSWLPRAMSCETCFVIIEKLSFAFPLRVKQKASVLFSKNYENSVMLLLFHWFFLLKDELKWSNFRQLKLKTNFGLTFARNGEFYLSARSPQIAILVVQNILALCNKVRQNVGAQLLRSCQWGPLLCKYRWCITSEVLLMTTSPLQIHNQPVV